MIPQLGTRWSLAAHAAALILVGAGGLLISVGARALPILVVVALVWPVVRSGPPHTAEILYRTESPYGRMAVVQQQTSEDCAYRMLFVNGIMQTGIPLDIARRDRTSLLRTDSYYLELLPYFGDDPDASRRCLLIGLAGGLFVRVMELYPVEVTAVEIDVKVAELARTYFGYRGRIYYPDGREHDVDMVCSGAGVDDLLAHGARDRPYSGRAIIQDGRRFLRSCESRYDFIVLDAYNSDTIPFHLVTKEMFTAVREHLTDDGVLAVNYIGAPSGDEVTYSVVRTLAEVFGTERVKAYRSTDDPQAVQVIYFFAFRAPSTEPSLPAGRWSDASGGQVDRLAYELQSRQLKFSSHRGTVITDDCNPIDVQRIKTALAWRTRTMSMFGELKLHRF